MTHDEKIVEAVARALCRWQIVSNLRWEKEKATPEFIQRCEDAGWQSGNWVDQACAAITAYQAEAWQPITTDPDRPMVVMFYSQNCVWHDQHGNEAPEWPPERDEKYSLGFWDGDWFWMGTAHRVFEWDPVGHPDMPSHWSPVIPRPNPPASP